MHEQLLKEIEEIGTAGYVLFLNYSSGGPEYRIGKFNEKWRREYDSSGYHWKDPVVIWVALSQRAGTKRWSQIRWPDTLGVLKKAKKFGMKFGAVAAMPADKGKHILSVSRSDREVTDEELDRMLELLRQFVDEYAQSPAPTQAEIDVIQILANDQKISDAASYLDVTEGSIKKRLQRAKSRLGFETNNGLIAFCLRHSLID